MPNTRAEIRRLHRAAWKNWRPLNAEPGDRRVIAPLCDWPGANRQEKRNVWRFAWPIWLEESMKQRAKEAEEQVAA